MITPQSNLNLGIARAGFAQEFENPEYGLSWSHIDHSHYKRYYNGNMYSVPGNIVRSVSGEVLIDTDEEDVWDEVSLISRHTPAAFNIVDTESNGIFFGRMSTLPVKPRISFNKIRARFSAEEIV